MRDPLIALVVILAVELTIGTVVARRRRGGRHAALLFAGALLISLVAFLFLPAFGALVPARSMAWLFVWTAVALQLAWWIVGTRSMADEALARRPAFGRAGLVMLATLVPLGTIELGALTAVTLGVIERYVPMETRMALQTEDWRLVHIMSDEFREPDPLLLWRPVPRAPYTVQRFRGPTLEIPKPAGTFRIMCYGDSNTDGPPTGPTWPAELQAVLTAHETARTHLRYEVVNAGVTGYSSYQGLKRFEQEVDLYEPDLVLVSFGWNDLAGAVGHPDKVFAQSSSFKAIDPALLGLRRVLMRYQTYLVAMRAGADGGPVTTDPSSYMPRVDRPSYRDNLGRFIETARAGGAEAVILTRPYRDATDVILTNSSWRQHVPGYNAEALRVAERAGGRAIDVQAEFEARTELFVDECHFTPEGHTAMANLLHRELLASGALP